MARRRYTRGRRRSRRGRMRRSIRRLGGGMTRRDISVIRDPFYANRNPKIPDGSAPESQGRQYRGTAVIDAVTARTVDLLIFPGLAGGVLWRNRASDEKLNPFNSSNAATCGILTNDVGTFNITTPTLPHTASTLQIRMNDNVAKWRQVSSGIRLKDLTADQTVKGWFEAIQINKQIEDSALAAFSKTNYLLTSGTALTDVVITPRVDKFKDIVMAQDPSYMTGSFSELSTLLFQLKRGDNDNHFAMPAKVTGFFGTAETTGFFLGDQPASPYNVSLGLMDSQYQYTLLRLYMPQGARLLLEYACNQEHIYEEASQLNSFMTKSYKYSGVETVLHRRDLQSVGTKRRLIGGFSYAYRKRRRY